MVGVVASASPQVRWGVVAPAGVVIAAAWLTLARRPESHALLAFSVMWLAMTLAMMVPTVTRPLLRAADGSAIRGWAFIAGFSGIWLAAGIPGYLLLTGVTWTPFWIASLWIVAGAYQLIPPVQRLLSSCRSVRYDGDPVRYGVRQGLRCLGSCAPVMIAVMATAMVLPGTILPLTLLIGVTVVLCWEKSLRSPMKAATAVGLLMVAVAAGALVLGVGGSESGHSHVSGSSTS